MTSTRARAWSRAAALVAIAVTAFADGGALDTTFGTGGFVRTFGGTRSGGEARSMVVQDDGRIVVAGDHRFTPGGRTGWTVRRHAADGSLDDHFGDGGTVALFGEISTDSAFDVALDASSRIVVAGTANLAEVGHTAAVVVRLSPFGTRDPSFGGDGVVAVEVPRTLQTFGRAVLVQPDGKILVAGDLQYVQTKHRRQRKRVRAAVFVARFEADGTPDQTFGRDGVVVHDILRKGTERVDPGSLALQSDGGIVVGSTTTNADDRFLVSRYLADGTIDAKFPVVRSPDLIRGLSVDSLDRIVCTATGTVGGEFGSIVRRFTPDGAPDSSFASAGTASFGRADGRIVAAAPAFDADGRIVVGLAVTKRHSPTLVAAARLTDAGALDGAFGSLGTSVAIGPGGVGNKLNACAFAKDGGILVAGVAIDGSGTNVQFDWLLVKFLAE